MKCPNENNNIKCKLKMGIPYDLDLKNKNKLLMKRYLFILLISLSYKISFGQVVPPQGITYQAVIIDRSIKELPGKDITERYYSNVEMVVKFSILSSQTGPTEYEETQSAKTDAYGLLNLIIGQGTPIGKNFNTIDWSKNEKWLKVEIDFNKKGTFELFSLEKMWSVPYALYSQRSAVADSIKGGLGNFKEKDGDTLNEIQTLKVKGDSIFISKGNSIKITHPLNLDNDSTNEIQLLSRVKDSVFISKGNGINLADLRDKDIDTMNEIQDLYLKNDSLGLTKSGKKISVSSLGTNNNGGINSFINQYVVSRPCHQVKSSFSLDSLIKVGAGIDINLILSKSSYHLLSTSKNDTLYFLKDSSIIKKLSVKYDNTLTGYLFENHFYVFVQNSALNNHVYPGKTINDKYYVVKLDTMANYKWHTAINGNNNPLFVGNYFISRPTSPAGVYNTIDLKTGNSYVITLTGSAPYKITPGGFCQSNNSLISFKGANVGTSLYNKIPNPINILTYYFENNNNKYLLLDSLGTKYEPSIANIKTSNNGIKEQTFDYLSTHNCCSGLIKSDLSRYLYNSKGNLFILTTKYGLISKKLLFDFPSTPGSTYFNMLLVSDNNDYFVPKFILYPSVEFPRDISSDGNRNNLLLRVDDMSGCFNGTVKNARWVLMTF